MKPTSILDPRFKYVPSEKTNIAKTFARIRREREQMATLKSNVAQIKQINSRKKA